MKTAVLHINKSNLPSSAFCGFAELFASANVIYIIGTKAAFNKHSFLYIKFKFNCSRFGGFRELFTSFFNFHNNFIVSRPSKPQLSSYTSYLRKMHSGFGGFFDDYYFLFICNSRNALPHTSSDTDLCRSLRVSGGFWAIKKQQYISGKSCGNRHENGSAKPAVNCSNGVLHDKLQQSAQSDCVFRNLAALKGSTPFRRSALEIPTNVVNRRETARVNEAMYVRNGVRTRSHSQHVRADVSRSYNLGTQAGSIPVHRSSAKHLMMIVSTKQLALWLGKAAVLGIPIPTRSNKKPRMTAGKDRHFLI